MQEASQCKNRLDFRVFIGFCADSCVEEFLALEGL